MLATHLRSSVSAASSRTEPSAVRSRSATPACRAGIPIAETPPDIGAGVAGGRAETASGRAFYVSDGGT